GHAVTPLEVAVPERVAVLDLLHADIQHVAEPQRVEVTGERTDAGVGRGVDLAGDRLRHDSGNALVVGQAGAHAQLGVHPAAVRVADLSQLGNQARVESEAGNVVTGVGHSRVTGPEGLVDVGAGRGSAQVDLGRHVRHGVRGRVGGTEVGPGGRVPAMQHGQVDLPGQRAGRFGLQETQHTGRVRQD